MIFIIFISLLIGGCADKNYVAFHGSSGPALSVSGTASMFKTSQSSQSVNAAATCTTATASLHGVNLDGSVQDTAIATTPIAVDGSFRFSSVQTKDINLNSSAIAYVIKASGCNNTYYRPLTNYAGQNITSVSTLFTMSSEVADTGRRNLTTVSRSEIENAISQFITVNANDALATVLQAIISTPSLSQEFQTVTNLAPVKLKETPPTSLEVTAPLELTEMSTNTYNVEIHHWNPEYVAAYQWLIDGQVVSTNSSFQYNTTKNSQGNHNLILKVGIRKNDGSLDLDKSIRSESYVLKVANTFPAIAPSLTLTSGTPPVSRRALTMNIDTGTEKINCATFSSMALTEDASAAPTEFPIMCSTAGLQNLSYTASSPNDGVKTLRLWTIDDAGNVSANPATLSVIIDTTAPIVTLAGAPATINNSTSLSINFSATDANAVLSYSCKLDSGSFAACSSPKSYSGLAQGSHSFSVKAVDSVANESTVVTSSWTTDLTLPTVNITGSAPAINNQLTNTFTFTGSDTGGGTIAGYLCSFDAATFSSCSSPKIELLAPGSHSFQVKSVDTAGNISTVQSSSFIIDTTVPTVSITSQPVALTNSSSAAFSFSGSDTGGGTIAGYDCSQDGSSYSACTSPQNLTGLASGSHVFSVKSRDTAGNISSAATYSWTIDLTTPIPNISASPGNITNSAAASFSFAANNPPSGTITGYECKLDSAAYSACSSPLPYTSLTQGSHTFSVRSIDNNSSASSATTLTWLIDLTKPVATIDAYPSSVNANTAVSIYFSASDTGGGTVTTFQCKLDSASYAACSSPVSFSSLTESSHTFSVKVSDSASNVSDVVTTTWSTDLTGPNTNIIASPLALTNSTTASLTFSASDSGGGTVVGMECSLDGAAYSSCSSPRSYSSLAQGAHSFSVRSTDSVGNLGIATSANWTVDITPPSVNISSAPALNSNSTSATFQFAGTDTGGGAVASYECSLDGASFATCTSPKNYTGLSAAAHSFYVRAIDTATNVSDESLHSWSIDTTPPVLTITTPGSNATLILASEISAVNFGGACETGLTITFTGISTGTLACSGGVWNRTLNLSSASEGTLSLTASQTDASGNNTSVTRTVIKDLTAPTISLTTVPSGNQKGGNATTVSFSVTELNISTSQSFAVSYSIDNGATWTPATTVASIAGPLSSQNFNATFALPSANSVQTKIKVEGSDKAGNNASAAISSAFTVDSTAPVMTTIAVNDGATVSLSPTLTVKLNVTDNLSGLSAIRIADGATDCQSFYADTNWQAYSNGGGVQSYSYVTGFSNGTHRICAWAKDASGNVSLITANSAAGTDGIDSATIKIDQGNPPVFTSLSVTNGNGSSANVGTTTFIAGDAVNISFTVTDDAALATNPISVYVTTNNSTYTLIASTTTLGSPGTAQTTWTKTYTGYSAPSASLFRIRLVAQDANGNTAQITSESLNTGKWSVFAGNDDIGDGSSALSARLRIRSSDSFKSIVAVNQNNVIFIATNDGIRKIDPSTGNISTYIAVGTQTGVPGTVSSSTKLNSAADLIMDGNDLYIRTAGKIYLVDTTNDSIKVFAGIGTNNSITDLANLNIWAYSAMAIDPVSKDLYFSNTCDYSVQDASNTVSIKIQKIVQNTTTKTPTSLVEFAGNCVKGSPTSGTVATASPLENSYYRSNTGSMLYVGGTLYFATYNERLLKFIGGKIYRSTSLSTTGLRGGVYIPEQNKVFYSIWGNGVYSFTPNTNAAFDESITTYINPEGSCTDPSCRNDGVSLSTAGVFTSALFSIGGKLGIVDNTTGTSSVGRIRVVDTTTNSLQTIAGTDRFTGNNGTRTLARFAVITGITYKSSAVTGFPQGLYVADHGSSRILYLDPADTTISVKAGSGISKDPTAGSVFGTSIGLGGVGQEGALYNITANPAGYFTFNYASARNVKSDGTMETFYNGGSASLLEAAEGSTPASGAGRLNEHLHGLQYDSSGNLYFGGYSLTNSIYNRIKVRKSDGTLYTAIGSNSNVSSSDCTTAGCAQSLSISGGDAAGGAGDNYIAPYDNRYNSNEGRLLFAEQNKIRFVNKAYDPTASKLGTLTNQAGTAINFGRWVGAFVYTYVDATSEQINKIYYISNDGALYCYKVSTGADATCNNTSLGPPTNMPSLKSTMLSMDESGYLYMVNSSTNVVLRYTP